MKTCSSIVVISALCLSLSPLWAQAPEGFQAQQTTPAWETSADVAERVSNDVPGPAYSSAPIVRQGQLFGWQNAPQNSQVEEEGGTLTELEKLSLSASGLSFGGDFYNAKSDNPLVPVAVTLRALDKITAQYTDLMIDINDTQSFGSLDITPRTCDKHPPEEVPETTAFLEIGARDLGAQTSEDGEMATAPVVDAVMTEAIIAEDLEGLLFTGWMFASSPALSSIDHPVYDVWVIDCKMVDPAI